MEARTIIALLKSCLERTEYAGKTFGIISLLGDEQPRLIEQYLFEQLDADVIDKRKIIYGTSAQFQGDERDVIFLSMVDSNEADGPLTKQGFGTDDMFRKRYNVAASRAKDQIWLVHSLDSGRDLKEGDIRKGLLDYSKNPQAFQQLADRVTTNAESPFEEMVGKALVAKGYSIVQQWPVGAYRIDMVAVDGEKRVAIECDGERWHSSELQVRNDMERQTILERLGWRFIRIRGSEYFRDPEFTMERVYAEIEALDIHTNTDAQIEQSPDSDLLAEIKRRAEELLTSDAFTFNAGDSEGVMSHALGSGDGFKSLEEPECTPLVERALEVTETNSKARPVSATPTMNLPTATTAIPTRKASKCTPRQSTLPDAIQEEDQLMIPGMEAVATSDSDVISAIRRAGVKYVDKRPNNGALWIIGGKELVSLVNECKKLGVKFRFKEGGGHATNNKDAWWA